MDPNDRDTPTTDDALDVAAMRPRRHIVSAKTVVAIACLAAVLGLLPMPLGFGPFASRLLRGENVPVYVYNTTGQRITVTVPFSAPLELDTQSLDDVETLTGPIVIEAQTADGTLTATDTLDAQGGIFYNAFGSACFAVFDVSGFYGGDIPTRVVARIPREQRVYPIEADQLILPRRTAPDRARGVVHWIEPVPCDLLDPSEEAFLIGRSELRLQQRRERREAERAAAAAAASQ